MLALSYWSHHARALAAALLLIACSAAAHAADTYVAGLLSVPSLTIGGATYSNLVLTVGSVISGPTGTAPLGAQDSYDIPTGQLTVPSVMVGNHPYYNVVVGVGSLVSVGSVNGADTSNGLQLSIPSVIVGGIDYTNVMATVGRVIEVAGGMPAIAEDQYDLTTGLLTIAAVQVAGGQVFTNVTVSVASVASIGGGVPVPTLGQVFPDTAIAGSAGFLLTANGSGFVNSSVLKWNGSTLPTSYVSATQLTAQVSPTYLEMPGSVSVAVSNAAVGGPQSNVDVFLVGVAPVPQLASLSPASVFAQGPAFTLTVTGSNFTPGSVVAWNGSPRATTYISASQVTAQINSTDITSPGNANVTVSDPASDNVASNAATFSVLPLTPVVSLTAFPTNVVAGKNVTFNWTGQYADGCTVSGAWSGSLPPSGSQTIAATTPGTYKFHLLCSHGTATASADISVTVGAAPVSPPATAYRISERHDGVLTTSNGISFPANSAPTWTVDLGAPVSYPLIAGGLVFVAVANTNEAYGNRLYALNATTGAIVWGPIAIAGVYFGSGLTYDNGRVFVLMFDGGIHAFNASNGAALWTTQLPGYWYDASPNAYGGIVFIVGNAGLTAVDEASGSILWTNGSTASTDWDSPAVSSEGVYTENGNCSAGADEPLSGATIWQTTSQCDGPWGYASIVKNGVLFGRVGSSLTLFNAETGSPLGQIASSLAPAVTNTSVITENSGTLSSTLLSSLVQTWTFTGDGHLVTAPLVVNNTVLVGSSSGNVYGLDVGTGAQVWVGMSPLAINPDSENGGPMPPSGPAAGENVLVYLAGNSVVAWAFQ